MGSFKDIIIKIGDFFSNYGINIVGAIWYVRIWIRVTVIKTWFVCCSA